MKRLNSNISAAIVALLLIGSCEQTKEAKIKNADADPTSLVSTTEVFFPGFKDIDETIDGINIHAVIGGSGPALLLLHGAPESHVMWHSIAQELAKDYTVVASDLRGYGRSGKPGKGDYSKRRMANDQLELMKKLGYNTFLVASHDRGSHVARRMAKDYPGVIQKLVIMDIIPSTYVFEHVDRKVANRYWSWFLWTQPEPLPELVMGPQAGAFAKAGAGTDTEAGDDYALTNGTAEAFHAMCEDYRAGASIDIEHDHVDADIKITTPTLVIWGKKSNTGNFDYPTIWSNEIENVAFKELDAGHFIVEEKPNEVLALIQEFLSQ